MRVLVIVLALVCAVSALPRQQRIVGGQATNIQSYPFSSSILSGSTLWGFFQNCGGTLITTSAVASAAHCFSTNAASSRVRLGSTFANSGGTVHIVSRIIRHAQYNSALLINDVAVLRLSVPAVLSNLINVARIAGPGYSLPANTPVTALGWGRTRFQGPSSEILQEVGIYIISQAICVERYAFLKTQPGFGNWPDVTPEMVCAGILNVGGKDACQGDSGGPLIHNRDVLVGVTSWGFECAHPQYPGVSARVSSYTDWFATNSVN